MFVAISNTPRDYAWGSTSAIADLLGRAPSGAPEAELWLGAHPGSPSRIDDGEPAPDLAAWIAADPAAVLGAASLDRFGPRLPFLLKVLAADAPLSLQAHPTMAQAAAGFARENAAGLAADAPTRNYKDAFHKPELIVALSPTFDALCGFRPVADCLAIVTELTALVRADDPDPRAFGSFSERLTSADPLRSAVEWLLRSGQPSGEVAALVQHVVELAARADSSGSFAREFATVGSLAEAYPGDPGIVISLLLNHVVLKAGQALYLPAGNIHAYLSGLGIELMAASDNVLRGGLTPKHIDVDELLGVLDFTPVADPLLVPRHPSEGVSVFLPDVPDFVLYEIEATQEGAHVPLMGPAIALCTAGEVTLTGAGGSASVVRGAAFFITPEEISLTVTGAGTVFIATVGA